MMPTEIAFSPLTPSRWDDLVTLFGERGACGGCWCMWWKLSRAEWTKGKGEANKKALRKIVMSKATPGIIAYDGNVPVAWCALEPRENYPVLERSRSLRRIDGEPVWSITCFFVVKSHRRRGLSVALLEAAAKHAKSKRAKILEGYPSVVRKDNVPGPFIWTGTETAFRKAGFVEVARPSPSRRIMRRVLGTPIS
jgi:GNAT superfamily N-acetyltransferase